MDPVRQAGGGRQAAPGSRPASPSAARTTQGKAARAASEPLRLGRNRTPTPRDLAARSSAAAACPYPSPASAATRQAPAGTLPSVSAAGPAHWRRPAVAWTQGPTGSDRASIAPGGLHSRLLRCSQTQRAPARAHRGFLGAIPWGGESSHQARNKAKHAAACTIGVGHPRSSAGCSESSGPRIDPAAARPSKRLSQK